MKPQFARATRFALLPTIVVSFGAATDVRAVDKTWQNGGTTDWGTGTNWSPSGAPGTGDNAIIISNTGSIATISASAVANDVLVGNGGGTNGLVNHTAGTLTTSQWFKVGHDGGSGVYNLGITGGAGTYTGLSLGSGSIKVGNGGQQLRLGGNGAGGGSGTLNVNTTGEIKVFSDIAVGENSNGTLNMDAGTITKTGGNFIVGQGVTGLMQMSGGTVNNTGEFFVGNDSGGSGTLTLSGGTINQDSWFSIGRNGSTGVVNLSGGTITKTATNSHFVVGDGTFANSTGTLNQTGGLLDLRSQLYIGKGKYDGTGGGTGTATISAGTVQVDSWLSVGRDGATGTLTISGTGSVTQGSVGDQYSNVELTNGTTGSATVNLGNGVAGGTLTAMGIQKSGGSGSTSTFNFNGGTLRAGRSNGTFMDGLTTARVRDGGGTIDTQAFDVTIAQNLLRSSSFGDAGTGVLRKIGSGALTLSGASDNSGLRFRVDNGTLNLAKASTSSIHAVGTDGGTDYALQITGGTAKLGGTGGDQIYKNSAVNMTGGTFDFAGLSEGFDGLSGSAGTITNSTAATMSTLTLGENNSSGTQSFAGIIQNGNGTVALVKTGSGTQALTGANTYSGGTSITGGTISIGHNTAFGTAAVAMSSGTTLTNTAALTVGNAFALTGSIAITGTSNLALTGAISSVGGAITVTKTGASVLTLSQDNSGGIAANSTWNVNGGTYNSSTGLYDNVIAVNMGQNLGSSSGNVLNLNGGTLRFNANGGNGYSSARTINVLSGGGSIDDGGFAFGEATGGGGVVAPNIVNNSGATLSLVSSNALVLAGNLSGNGSVAKFGVGTASLNGIATYTGTTTVNAGTLSIGGSINNSATINVVGGTLSTTGSDKLANSAAVTVSGGTLAMGGNNDTVGTVVLSSGSITGTGGTLTGTSYDLRSGSVSAKLGGSGVALNKTTAGTVTLTGANTYSGATTISEGTLALGAGGSINNTSGVSLGTIGTFDVAATGGYTVNNLSGSGTVVGSLTVSTQLAIGNSPGIINFESLTLATGSTYLYELTGNGVSADLGNVSKSLTIDAGAILDLVDLATSYTDGKVFTLFAYTAVNNLSGVGTFSGLNNGDTFSDAGGMWQINYDATSAGLNGGTGDRFVTITAVPESNVAALIGGFGTLLLLRRKRQRN